MIGSNGGSPDKKTRQFENQMKYLFENGYKSLSLGEALRPEVNSPVGNELSESQLLERKALRSEKGVVITFDDGYESVYKFAFPILQKYSFVASVFIITGYVGKFNDWDVTWGKRFRHLSWEQIKELAKYGFFFGSHTVSHPDLTKLDSKSLQYELSCSKKTLEDKIGKRVDFLSYPLGKYNTKVQEMVKETGYQKAFTISAIGGKTFSRTGFSIDQIVESYCDTPLPDLNSLALGRMGMYFLDSTLTLHIKLNGGKLFWIEEMKGRIINTFATGTVLAKSNAG